MKTSTASSLVEWDAAVYVFRQRLDAAHKAFRNAPTSTNWRAMTRAMLVYQQTYQVRAVERAALGKTLSTMHPDKWDEFIVFHVTGKSIDALSVRING